MPVGGAGTLGIGPHIFHELTSFVNAHFTLGAFIFHLKFREFGYTTFFSTFIFFKLTLEK